MSFALERRLLQIAVAVLALVPICAGALGAIYGIGVFDSHFPLGRDVQSHGRYLSGLLLAIGLAYWTTVPRIETEGPRFRLLTAIVFIGGLARLYDLVTTGPPSNAMVFGLVMELAVTPALALWRERIDRRGREFYSGRRK